MTDLLFRQSPPQGNPFAEHPIGLPLRYPFESRAATRLELKRYADTMEFVEDNELPPGIDRGDVTLVEIEEPDF